MIIAQNAIMIYIVKNYFLIIIMVIVYVKKGIMMIIRINYVKIARNFGKFFILCIFYWFFKFFMLL